MTKILVMGKLHQDLLTRLEQAGHTVNVVERKEGLPRERMAELLHGHAALICEPQESLREEDLEAYEDLRIIGQRAVGHDNIDIKAASKRDILVMNTPGVLDNATADLAFALMLAAARRIVEADHFVRAGKWEGFESDLLLGCEITGKTMGIVGLGRIGQAFARRARGFGMKIVYTRSGERDAKDDELEKEFDARRTSLSELAEISHFVSLHCPLTRDTTGSIDAAFFARLQKGCVFVNTSRGKVVDQAALIDCVKSGKIVAALDVFDGEPSVPQELIKASNVVMAPHIGSATAETRHRMAELIVDGVLLALSGKMPPNALNPDISLERLP